jgi:cytoskeleton-associated protein 5
LNPQLLGIIQSEFDKVDGQSIPTATRFSADLAIAAPAAPRESGDADPLDELFPRVDLDRLLVGTSVIADAKSDAWKVRKEALEALQGILDVGQNKRLKSSMGTQIRLTLVFY